MLLCYKLSLWPWAKMKIQRTKIFSNCVTYTLDAHIHTNTPGPLAHLLLLPTDADARKPNAKNSTQSKRCLDIRFSNAIRCLSSFMHFSLLHELRFCLLPLTQCYRSYYLHTLPEKLQGILPNGFNSNKREFNSIYFIVTMKNATKNQDWIKFSRFTTRITERHVNSISH